MDIHRPSTPAPSDVPFRAAEIPVSVLRFSDRLRHLPLGIWAELAERIGQAHADDGAPIATIELAVARHRLRQVADGMPSAVTRVRGRILEMVSCAEGFFRPEVLLRMKKVALTAALALAARPYLAPEEFNRLYEPFAAVIPLEDLGVAPAAAFEGDRPVLS
jgi:hypothetical protein